MLLAYSLGRVEGMMKVFYLIEKEQDHPIFGFVKVRFPEMAIKLNRMAEKYGKYR